MNRRCTSGYAAHRGHGDAARRDMWFGYKVCLAHRHLPTLRTMNNASANQR